MDEGRGEGREGGREGGKAYLFDVIPQLLFQVFSGRNFLRTMGRARQGRREEEAQGLLEEDGGLSVAIAAAPIVGNGQVEDHPLGEGEGGREGGRGERFGHVPANEHIANCTRSQHQTKRWKVLPLRERGC